VSDSDIGTSTLPSVSYTLGKLAQKKKLAEPPLSCRTPVDRRSIAAGCVAGV
jgi:hypothetical protein